MARLVTRWIVAVALAALGAGADAAPRSATEAIPELIEETRERPDDPALWAKLARAHTALSQWDEAIAAYRESYELEPSDPVVANNLGNVYFRRGDLVDAAGWYARAVELDPRYLRATFHLGWTLRQLNRADDAAEAFESCLGLEAEDNAARSTRVDCAFGLGSIRHRQGDYATSATLMEQVLSVHPGHIEARYLLGIAYRQLGRIEDARKMLDTHRAMLRSRREATGGMPPDR